MDLNALRDYTNWIGKSAQDIVNSVKIVPGGWASVFPDHLPLPLWAHRVRNFFNEEPIWLKRHDAGVSREFLALVRIKLNPLVRNRKTKALKNHPIFKHLPEVKKMPDPPPGTPDYSMADDAAETFALSDYVYNDNAGKNWYQMSPGATIYHWGSKPKVTWIESPRQSFRGQAVTPVFKLVSPDGTGGSHETIIKNPQNRQVNIGAFSYMIGRWSIEEVGVEVDVFSRIETDLLYQGSYNYSETVDVGLPAHEKRDVWPHEKNPRSYINPPDRFKPLATRFFPVAGGFPPLPLAMQI